MFENALTAISLVTISSCKIFISWYKEVSVDHIGGSTQLLSGKLVWKSYYHGFGTSLVYIPRQYWSLTILRGDCKLISRLLGNSASRVQSTVRNFGTTLALSKTLLPFYNSPFCLHLFIIGVLNTILLPSTIGFGLRNKFWGVDAPCSSHPYLHPTVQDSKSFPRPLSSLSYR